MKFNPAHLSDWRVVSYTRWVAIGKHNFEARSGVYIFASADHHVKYVGKAGPGRMQDEVNDAISRGKDYRASLVRALYTNSNANALSLEKELIKYYSPPNNIVGK